MVFDTIIKPLDSYWHKKFESAQREQKRVESFLNHSEAIREAREKELAALGKKADMQQQTISAFEEELKKKNELVETLQRQLGGYQQRAAKQGAELQGLVRKLEEMEELREQLRDYKELSRRLQEELAG